MRVKKNAFGFISLLCGTLFMSVCLYTLFVSFYKDFNFASLSDIEILDYIIPGVFVLLVIGLFVGYRFLRKKIISNTDYKKDYKKLCVFCCVFAVACVLAAAVLVNKNVLDTTVLLKKADSSGYNVLTDYFYKENVSFNGVFQFLYTAFISILFRFYGIAIEVPVITNLILFLVSGIFIFIVIYKVFGVFSAVAGSFAFFLCKGFDDICFDFYGKNLWIFAASLVVFLGVLILDKVFYERNVAFNISFFVFLVIVGLCKHFFYSGYLFSADNFNLSFDIINSGNQIFDVVVILLCLFGFLYYLFDDRDGISFTFVLLLASYFAMTFSVGDNLTEFFIYIVIAVLAGLGAKALIVNGPAFAGMAAKVKKEKPVKEKKVRKAKPIKDNPEDVDDNDDENDEEDDDMDENQNAQPVDVNDSRSFKKVPAYFDSPIPLPKRHSRKVIEFDFEPEKEDMHYDYEVPAYEDFDIK